MTRDWCRPPKAAPLLYSSEERFLATKADRFAGAKRKEKTSAFSARNDSWVVEERSE